MWCQLEKCQLDVCGVASIMSTYRKCCQLNVCGVNLRRFAKQVTRDNGALQAQDSVALALQINLTLKKCQLNVCGVNFSYVVSI